MLTAASCSTSGLCVVFLGLVVCVCIYIYIYIYIYMQCRLSARAYMVIYAYMQVIYAYIEPGKHMYRPYIYVFHVYMCVFVQVACCIYANECNLMQMYAPLHITRYRLKACREKVRWEAGPREEGGKGATSIEWEKLGFSLIFTLSWDYIKIAICMFVLRGLWSDIVAITYNTWEKGSL